MLDVLIAGVVARHYGQRADEVGRPRSKAVGWVFATCVAGEAVGLVLAGVRSGWTLDYVVLGAALGLTFGVTLGCVVGNTLTIASTSRVGEPTVVVGDSLGPQVIGSPCPVCERPIQVLFEAKRCKRCALPVHKRCLSDHRLAHRIAGKGYRDAIRSHR
ncbi:MAG: hypothetical protein U0414_21790 [Polyangiaceae bacterium]